jgi:methionine synthase / methylenetetrahydrofolate reductase (NADH)
MASYARRFVARGVRLVGGCCGTTPEHIRQIRAAVGTTAAASRVKGPAAASVTVQPSGATAQPIARPDKSRFANAIARGTFVVAVELVPPRGLECEQVIERARVLKIRGVDVINVPDGPLATSRMSALALAVLIEQQAGIETLLHYACRDRNLLGMQSDLIGAHAMGLRNLLVVTGDPPREGSYPDATAVYDVDSIGLTNVVSRLNRGLDIGGQNIGRPTAFHVGVAANPDAINLDEEIRRFEYKVEAGAEFAVTQPIFDVRAFERFLKRVEGARIPIITGIWPFESARNAEFMANEVPGITVPDELLDRMRRAERDGRAVDEGVTIAREIVRAITGMSQGIQVSAPSGNISAALAVIASGEGDEG